MRPGLLISQTYSRQLKGPSWRKPCRSWATHWAKNPTRKLSLCWVRLLRLGSEANKRKQYRAGAQACETMEYLAGRRPALEKELRSRIGVEGRLPEFIEDALREPRVSPELVGVLRRNATAAAEHLAERFFRSMRREECDRIAEVVGALGLSANDCLREMLKLDRRQAVSSVGLMSRLDVPGAEFLLSGCRSGAALP